MTFFYLKTCWLLLLLLLCFNWFITYEKIFSWIPIRKLIKFTGNFMTVILKPLKVRYTNQQEKCGSKMSKSGNLKIVIMLYNNLISISVNIWNVISFLKSELMLQNIFYRLFWEVLFQKGKLLNRMMSSKNSDNYI